MTPILDQIDAAIRTNGYQPTTLLLKDIRAELLRLQSKYNRALITIAVERHPDAQGTLHGMLHLVESIDKEMER